MLPAPGAREQGTLFIPFVSYLKISPSKTAVQGTYQTCRYQQAPETIREEASNRQTLSGPAEELWSTWFVALGQGNYQTFLLSFGTNHFTPNGGKRGEKDAISALTTAVRTTKASPATGVIPDMRTKWRRGNDILYDLNRKAVHETGKNVHMNEVPHNISTPDERRRNWIISCCCIL